MAAAFRRVWISGSQSCRTRTSCRTFSTGHGFLPRPRPLPFLLVTGSSYLGYKQYKKWGQQEDGALPSVATPTQMLSSENKHQKQETDRKQMLLP